MRVALLLGIVVALAAVRCGGRTDSTAASAPSECTPPAGSALSACSVSSECQLRRSSCTGSCRPIPYRGEAAAIARACNADYEAYLCRDEPKPYDQCILVGIPLDPTLLATCSAGQCTPVDLLEQPLTACTIDADCRTRWTDCCETGNDWTLSPVEALIAIRADGEEPYRALVCDLPEPCGEPPTAMMPGVVARCGAGRCSWDYE